MLEAVQRRLREHADRLGTETELRRGRVGYVVLGMLASPEPLDHLGGGWAPRRRRDPPPAPGLLIARPQGGTRPPGGDRRVRR
ncbi:hypothetical protein MUU72_33830 [Streptomyces sp. RS10V-4]|uniref:hypothetical protein n=1 Tax=Streptomyces rhizoryzae TaxID=2932493 RepID=UPI002005EB98|nr:hypothetical protein [Streptomyces rhizoryzae]MCK7628011.1 hypothetical protein [Streptomyces rhizoryzae]